MSDKLTKPAQAPNDSVPGGPRETVPSASPEPGRSAHRGTLDMDDEALTARKRRQHAENEKASSQAWTQQSGSQSKPQEGLAKSLDRAGAVTGTPGVGKFVQRSDSGGGIQGDAKSVASGAVTGAQIGAKVGGPVGTAVGALAGGAVQGLKTKNGRVALGLIVAAPVVVPLAIFMVLAVTISMLVSGSSTYAAANAGDTLAVSAATTDGMAPDVIDVLREDSYESGVPWEVLAAIIKVSGNIASTDRVDPVDQKELKEYISDNAPMGPYSVLVKDLDERVVFTDEIVENDDRSEKSDTLVLSLGSHRNRTDLFAQLGDFRTSTTLMGSLLRSSLAAADTKGKFSTYALDAGVYLIEGEGNDNGLYRAYETDRESYGDDETGQFLDPGGNSIFESQRTNAAGNARSRALRDLYMVALSGLPIRDAEANAEAIYDQAMAWFMGHSAPCVVGTGTATATGAWSNPVLGTVTSPYGMRYHPVRLRMSLHDGTDIAAPQGTTVHAAGSGTITVLHETWSGTNNLVNIDHGSGLSTEYGHLSEVLVTNGQQVSAGDPIGKVGSEGYSTGPHLHLIVNEAGRTTDPEPFFTSRGVSLGVDNPQQPVGTTDTTHTGDGTALPPQVGADEVRIVHTNMARIHTTPAQFTADRNKAASYAPDFITFNEVSLKGSATYTPPGYSSWRAGPAYPATESQGTAIAWRNDRWQIQDKGRIQITKSSSRLDNRWAHWVTLTSPEGRGINIISTHAMTNPRNSSTSRKNNYRSGMESLNGLIRDLSSNGPVLIGGDFNSWAPRRGGTGDPWGPTNMLAKTGMKSTFDALGQPGGVGWATHVGGGTIDYVFYQADSGLVPLTHSTYRQHSDHHAIVADFKFGEGLGDLSVAGGTLPNSFSAQSALGETVTLDRQQVEFAAQIARKGVEMGVSDAGIIVALMTVFVESKFANWASDKYPVTQGHEYPAGRVGSDFDSVGLFQQRPAAGWGPKIVTAPGTPAEMSDDALTIIQSVDYQASAFFGGPSGPNGGSPRGLLDVAGWEALPKGEAAQAVQVSAFPDKYAHWEESAAALLSAVKGASAGDPNCPSTGTDGGGFRIATLNVMGDAAGSAGRTRQGWASPPARMEKVLDILEKSNVTVAGLQDVHSAQWQVVKDDSAWSVYPEESNGKTANSVVWRSAEWTLLEGKQFTVPFSQGHPAPQSYVRLRNNSTAQEVYVVSVHNVADAQWRTAALNIEKDIVTTLKASGHPVFLVGDFNDVHEPYCVLSPLMESANGTGASPCKAPRGTTEAQVYGVGAPLSDVKVDRKLKNQRVSDHPLVTATVGGANGGAVQTAIDYAMTQVGKGYSQAGRLRMGPAHFDCSGLMYMAYKQAGVTLGTYTGTQQHNGTPVTRDDLRPGDLIFYYSPVSHVAMYIGERNGVPSIVHAANPRDGVEVAPLSEMESSIVSYRRVA